MKHLANIISDSKVEINSFFNVVDDISDADLSLPTLVVGWYKVKKFFPKQSILEKHIESSKIYWTFSVKEKRSDYEDDIENFMKVVEKEMDEMVNYKFYNYIVSDEAKKENFISYMNKGGRYIYINKRFAYVYDGKYTTGISLSDIDYMGISKKGFIDSINRNKNNIIITPSFIDSETDVRKLIKGNVKALPMLKYLIEH